MTLALLFLVIYIGLMLREEKSTLTTIKKTKASSLAYTKTINLNQPVSGTPSVAPTEIIIANKSTITPSPTTGLFAQGQNYSLTPTIGPTVASNGTPTPTSSFLARNNITPSPTVKTAVSSAKATELPSTGKSDYLVSLVIAASIIIFFSFLY